MAGPDGGCLRSRRERAAAWCWSPRRTGPARDNRSARPHEAARPAHGTARRDRGERRSLPKPRAKPGIADRRIALVSRLAESPWREPTCRRSLPQTLARVGAERQVSLNLPRLPKRELGKAA